MTTNPLGIRIVRELDLSKGEGHKHPDIVAGQKYLCLIYGQWHLGTFSEQWYGLNFGPWTNGVGIQYDTPGSNGVCSGWERVIEIELPPAMQIQGYEGFKPKPKYWECLCGHREKAESDSCNRCYRERDEQ